MRPVNYLVHIVLDIRAFVHDILQYKYIIYIFICTILEFIALSVSALSSDHILSFLVFSFHDSPECGACESNETNSSIFSFFIQASSLEIRDTRSRIQDHNPRDALRASGFILSLRLSAWHQWHVTEIMD